MSRLLVLFYGTLCYSVFVPVFLYLIAFIEGIAPKHIDNGLATPFASALVIDLVLLAVFAVQHSVMARPAFKRWWTRLTPPATERSTYVLASSVVLVLLLWQWRPLPQVVWQVEDGAARMALYALSTLGWALVFASTFLINHFDLFGLRQVWLHARNREAPDIPFMVRTLYRFVRHPLMLGFLIAFWAAPTMTAGHLLFTLTMTAYTVISVKFLEERDLVAQFGDAYRDYQRRVPMLLPRPNRPFKS